MGALAKVRAVTEEAAPDKARRTHRPPANAEGMRNRFRKPD